MDHLIPNDETEFIELMESVDKELADAGYSIPQRPIQALRIVSSRFRIPLPITTPIPGMSHEANQYWPISSRIYKWYDERYGDRLKIDFAPGRMVFRIGNDLWGFRFPKIYGSANLIASRTERSDRLRTDGKPVIFNVVDSIDSLPDGLRLSLTDQQLHAIFNSFILGFAAFDGLEQFRDEQLVKTALADISAAVDHLLGTHPNYGLSKWSSLQAAEKLLKFSISQVGGAYPKVHKLDELISEAAKHRLSFQLQNEIALIHCTPSIRYGQESCSRDEALEAHHATFRVAKAVSTELVRVGV